MIHLVLHLPEEAILGGPVFMRWMYPFERYMKKLKNYVGNKARPEGSIAEGYVADEAVTFCSMYFKGCETRFNRLDRNEDAPSVSRYLSVFNSQSRPLTSGLIKPLDHISREKAEWYILQNSPEIQAYLDEHLDKIRHEYPNGNHDVLHRQTFRPWFHKKIYELHKLGTLQNGDELLALASGSDYLATFYEGCVVNGVRFIASKRDQKRKTQNSGVTVAGTEGFNYYGTLEDVITISYTGAYTLSLFESTLATYHGGDGDGRDPPDPSRGGPPGEHVVEAWKEIHVKKPSGTFVNELAAKDYEELIKELDRKRLEQQSQSDTGTESESDTGYQFDVMETVLGQRSDYQIGVGKRLKGKGKKPIPQTQSTVPPQPTTEMMSTVADIFSAMRATWGVI
ncbi:uncharacterized protein LOC133038317 [Cannabis sativa]|uniref:uncharacterized protein LOC133038317 n=1 Tax=Cannabis sativa TaxID=3483 RepID=UPI0029CA1F7D|nr:uncharacterized protein LOC133038317 [Cannabis sativa]